jgi:hypothetical protein
LFKVLQFGFQTGNSSLEFVHKNLNLSLKSVTCFLTCLTKSGELLDNLSTSLNRVGQVINLFVNDSLPEFAVLESIHGTFMNNLLSKAKVLDCLITVSGS